jgi:hypothetical protein
MVTLEVLELPLRTDLLLASRRETPESANGKKHHCIYSFHQEYELL